MLGYLIQVPVATKFIVLRQLIFGTYTSHRHQNSSQHLEWVR